MTKIIIRILFTVFLLIGTLAWVNHYVEGRLFDGWTVGFIILCGVATLFNVIKVILLINKYRKDNHEK